MNMFTVLIVNLVLVLTASSVVQGGECKKCLIGCGIEPIVAGSNDSDNAIVCADTLTALLNKHGGGSLSFDAEPKTSINGKKYSLVGTGSVTDTKAKKFSYEISKGSAAASISCQYCVAT